MKTNFAGMRAAALLAIAVALTGCASLSEKDPYEKYNRSMFSFNDAVDRNALKPVATAYKTVLPSFVQTGVNNFFGNLGDIWTGANNFMQGKGERGFSDLTRVMINSTFGLAGLLDIASDAGLQKHNEDFGQTLGYWGMPSGPYVMLPLLGPSTLRDTAALPVDIYADPWGNGMSSRAQNIGTVLRVVDQRAVLLDATNLMEEAALDRYEFIRDGYLQQRQNRIFDGEASRKEAQAARRDDAEPTAQSIRAAYEDPDAGAPAKAAETPAPTSADVPAAAPAAAPADAAPAAPATAAVAAPAEPEMKPVSSESPTK
ncbi:VacJ family lipoprotein [Massilia sp. CF038]|uniref:MlaA family lipoprotein n=1 Tax=Massilia sp. CF038 TaxID=1881045 RepID=UPI0035A33079